MLRVIENDQHTFKNIQGDIVQTTPPPFKNIQGDIV